MKIDQYCYIIILLTFTIFQSCRDYDGSQAEVCSNALDERQTQHLLDSLIERRNLSLTSFNRSGFDFQYLNEDEWGISFLLIRVDFNKRIMLIEQDSFTGLFNIFKYDLIESEGDTINDIVRPIVNGDFVFPSSERHLMDGGNISMLYKNRDTIFVKYWQHNPRLPQNDIKDIEKAVTKLRQYIKKRKSEW